MKIPENIIQAIIHQKATGISMGAATLTAVTLEYTNGGLNLAHLESSSYEGNPGKAILDICSRYASKGHPVVVTGRKFKNLVNLPFITEPEATEQALRIVLPFTGSCTGIASLGAENFVAYSLNSSGLINSLHAKNQCASGTGDFFLQQIKRMSLPLNEAIEPVENNEFFRVSGRCSVFCKSDCTHALNKGIPKKQVAAGLSVMVAEKVKELLLKLNPGRIVLVGGVTLNTAVVNYLRKNFPELVIPEHATHFEALGAAIYALTSAHDIIPGKETLLKDHKTSFTFHQPLTNFLGKVSFLNPGNTKASPGGGYILGLDVGSTTTKGVLIREKDAVIEVNSYIYTNGNPIKAAKEVYADLQNQVPENINIIGMGVTGSGRYIAGIHAQTEGIINEISAHARAAVHFDKDVDTIIEIGGQDAKFTYIINGVPADYAMNEACSAGTGSFIEEVAFESLHLGISEIEPLAMQAKNPLNLRDQCSALIGSDIRTAMQENFSREDIVAGLVYSVCMNYNNRVKGKRQIGKKIFMQGGVCYNKAIPVAMAAITGKEIIVPPHPGLMGAFGTALFIREQISNGSMNTKKISLADLANRDYSIGKSFICTGGTEKCDRHCEIQSILVEGKKVAFGGACNKYYNMSGKKITDRSSFDYVKLRHDLIYGRYLNGNSPNNNSISVGINQSLITHALFPLYHTFFSKLGVKIILSDNIDLEGVIKQQSSFCLPAQISHGLFLDLMKHKPDFIFMPEVYEMHVKNCENDLKDSNATCVMVSKEANFIGQAFNHYIENSKFIHPYLNFAKGYHTQESAFVRIARQMNIAQRSSASNAYIEAVKEQHSVERSILSLGNEILDFLEKNPDEIAIVIVGRGYNSFSNLANKGIPQKFASRGIRVMSYDMLDGSAEALDNFQSWESGKNILRAARIIKSHNQLFPVYISNYSCGPDSILIPQFRNIMSSKPSLTLELDEHTADAGINTRIEAFLDIVNNYRNLPETAKSRNKQETVVAKIEDREGIAWFCNSDGQYIPLNDQCIKILIPSMGDMVSELFAAALRSIGFNAKALPEHTSKILGKGIANLSGKECLPLILLAGSIMDYIDKRQNDNEHIALLIVSGVSACRMTQYQSVLERMLKTNGIRNVAVLSLANHEGYIGLAPGFLKRSMEAIILNDVLEDVRSGILANALDADTGIKYFYNHLHGIYDVFANDHANLFRELKQFSKMIAENIPFRMPIHKSRYIGLTGEIFVRHDQFSHKWLNYYFGRKGFILKNAYIAEWILYIDYAWRNGVDRPRFGFMQIAQRLFREQYLKLLEKRIKSILSATGYCEKSIIHVKALVDHSKHVLPLESTGEPALALGTGLSLGLEKYCGIINVGPFGCLQTRIGEAVCTPQLNLRNKLEVRKNLGYKNRNLENMPADTIIPFLTIESDGMEFPQIIESRLETFLLQAERTALLMESSKKTNSK